MQGRDYLLGVQPIFQVIAEVLRPTDPLFSQIPGMYAVKVLSLPILPSMYEDISRSAASVLSVGDIILVSGFTTVYTDEQLRSDAAENSWNSIMTSEIRYTQRLIEETRDGGAEVGHPVAVDGHPVAVYDSPVLNGDLAQATIRRSIEDDVTLYASINPSNIFGKVLQGCAR